MKKRGGDGHQQKKLCDYEQSSVTTKDLKRSSCTLFTHTVKSEIQIHAPLQKADATLKTGFTAERDSCINRPETLRGHKQRDTTRTQDAECLDRKCHKGQDHNLL